MGSTITKPDGTTVVNDFTKYQPFTFRTDAGISVFYDGTSIENAGFDYNSNVLMTDYAEPIKVFDFFDTVNADWKSVYKNSKLSTVTMRDSDTTFAFFNTNSGTLTNDTVEHQSDVLYDLNISQVPVVSVYAFGKQLATFENPDSAGKDGKDLATTQKLLEINAPDGTKTPVDRVILKGKNNKSVKSVRVSTYNVKLREKLYPELSGGN